MIFQNIAGYFRYYQEDDADDSSRHVHDEGGEGTGDDDEVHAVPHLAHIGPRV